MTITDLPPAMLEFVGTFQALRSLGFESDDIQCAFYSSFVQGQLHTQGKVFRFDCGYLPDGYEGEAERTALYRITCAALETASHEEREHVYESTFAFDNKILFVDTLMRKGFMLPIADGLH